MDDKLKRKIMLFYAGGIINALLGLFVLIEGLSYLPPDTARTLGIIFFVFAAVAQAKMACQQSRQAGAGQRPGSTPVITWPLRNLS